jgi:hypothetical protein
VVPGVLRVEPRRPFPDRGLSDHLAVLELIARQIEFHPARKPVPHVPFHSLAVSEHVRRQDLSAEDVVHDQRSHVALAARGIPGRPTVVLFGSVEAPAGSDGGFDLGERVDRLRISATLTPEPVPERESESSLSNDQLTDRWERQELGGSGVSHVDYVRVAWVLQRRHGPLEAEERLVEGTRKGCDHYRIPEKFDEVLTHRWAQAISEAAAGGSESESFEEFIARNPELRRGDLYG